MKTFDKYLYEDTPLKVVCAWCGALMKDGQEPISHGICPKCVVKFEAGK